MADDQNWKTVGPDRRDPDYKEAQRVVDEHYDQGPNYSSPEASMTNPDTYITPDGSRVEPADNNGNNFLYSREQDGETVYQNIVEAFNEFAKALTFTQITHIPISALRGDNVVTRSSKVPWYLGPTLLGFLETIDVRSVEKSYPEFWLNF